MTERKRTVDRYQIAAPRAFKQHKRTVNVYTEYKREGGNKTERNRTVWDRYQIAAPRTFKERGREIMKTTCQKERERERMENGDGGIDRCSSCRGGGFSLFPSLEDSSIPCFPPPSPGQLHQNTNPRYAEQLSNSSSKNIFQLQQILSQFPLIFLN